jgi:hypothetical protein
MVSFVCDNPELPIGSRRTWDIFIQETGSKRNPDSLKSQASSSIFKHNVSTLQSLVMFPQTQHLVPQRTELFLPAASSSSSSSVVAAAAATATVKVASAAPTDKAGSALSSLSACGSTSASTSSAAHLSGFMTSPSLNAAPPPASTAMPPPETVNCALSEGNHSAGAQSLAQASAI